MNTADKKRIEEMLRERASSAVYRGEDAIKHPRPEVSASMKQRLDAAVENMKPSEASINRMESVVEAVKETGFDINWTRPRINVDFSWQSATAQEHPEYVAYRQAKLDNTTAVRDARDAAIIALWSNDEFNIQVYFERIDASV